MPFRVGLENHNDDRSIAWALEHPGCFAYGTDGPDALANFPRAARDYAFWVRRHGGAWLADQVSSEGAGRQPVLIHEETFDVYFVDANFERKPGKPGMVESFFGYDWKPLTATDIEHALKLLEWSRADLLGLVRGLNPDDLCRKPAGERWDINGILKHIGGAEWWYQERIGHPFPGKESDLASDPFQRLQATRAHFRDLLPQLEGLNHVVGLDGEFWSPRKVLRRAAWHERDHTEHVRKLL
jgi:hypothetical protein